MIHSVVLIGSKTVDEKEALQLHSGKGGRYVVTATSRADGSHLIHSLPFSGAKSLCFSVKYMRGMLKQDWISIVQ